MKGYKAFNKGLIAYGGFQYEIGKEYTIIGELKMCKNGFHFCENLIDVFGYYPFDRSTTVFAEVEASGKILQEGTKYCAEKIMLVRKIEWDEIDKLISNKRGNSGKYNSGKYNSGDCNSGYHNSGNYNSGSCNSGDCNSGSRNSGSCNSGDCNSGYYNSGDCNSGDYNSGYYNSGNYNSGTHNSGSYNSGSHNSGFFNTNTPTIRLFNKDSGMTFEEFYALGINIHNLEESKAIIQALPNFDAQVFYDATGIDWRAEAESYYSA